MPHTVSGVAPGSPAMRAGILPGDQVISIDGRPIVDVFDYQMATGVRRAVFALRRGGADVLTSVRKAPEEAVGLDFEDGLLGPLRRCRNRCVFCFADQLPPEARDSLRIKDDDWRHSVLFGTYVTLTNVGDGELDRIADLRIGPLYLSVHAADPALRARLLGIGEDRLARQLEVLRRGDVAFHAQIVLCPGLNDGTALEDTLAVLAGRHPQALSVAVVPVGLTAHRQGLPAVRAVGPEDARRAVDAVERAQARCMGRLGTRFAFASDELYLRAGRDVPPYEAYEDFPQWSNGVGMLASLERELFEAAEAYPLPPRHRAVALATGVSAAPFLRRWIARLPLSGVSIAVIAVPNRFFGPSVTVAGLLTGRDVAAAVLAHGGAFDELLIPSAMLRGGEEVFLDDTTPGMLSEAIGLPVIPTGGSGEALWQALCGRKASHEEDA